MFSRLLNFLNIECTEFDTDEEVERALEVAVEEHKIEEAKRGLRQLLPICLPGSNFVVEIGGEKTRYIIESAE